MSENSRNFALELQKKYDYDIVRRLLLVWIVGVGLYRDLLGVCRCQALPPL
jgi:hypothetical protein